MCAEKNKYISDAWLKILLREEIRLTGWYGEYPIIYRFYTSQVIVWISEPSAVPPKMVIPKVQYIVSGSNFQIQKKLSPY